MPLTHADYVGNDATGLASLIRRREISKQEVVRCALELAEALNPEINAFVEIFDEPLEANPDGPFAGVPFAIKDLVCQARGTKYECGSRLGVGVRADHDTDLMKRFRDAGCRTIGRTAAPEFGFCVTTEPVATGPVRNPWDLERMPGGSSGGSAAAIAAGIVPFAHGNDGAGSIRIPAACTGLVGLKTSRGRVTVGPDAGELLNGLAVEFALTRSVRDCAGLLDAVHGYVPGDPFPLAPPPGSYSELCLLPSRPLRIALMTRPWSDVEVAQDSIDGAERAGRLCQSLGHRVELAAPPMDYDAYLEATHSIWVTMVHGAVNAAAAKSGLKVGPQTLEATTLACYLDGAATRADQLQSAFGVVNQVTRSFARFFQDYDVLLTPTLASPALPLGVLNANNPDLTARQWTERVFAFAPFTAPFNMTGQPALSLPLHRTSANLPVGVQFAARIGEEHTLLNLGICLENAAPWPTVAPIWSRCSRIADPGEGRRGADE